MQFNDQVIYFTIDFFHWYGRFQKYCKTLIFFQHSFMDKEMATGKVKWLAQSRMAGKWQTRTRVCDWTSSINSSVLLPTTTFTVLLLLLLSHFSHVQLCATPSLGFSRQEPWIGLPYPSPMQKSESEVAQSCQTLWDPMDCSLPGSSVHGIFQAIVLEWGAIAFSVYSINMW